jgi:cation-transporting P-type ATPase E
MTAPPGCATSGFAFSFAIGGWRSTIAERRRSASAERRSRGPGNALPPATGRTYREILRDTVLTFVNGVIFVMGLALVALGQWSYALVSVGVVTINVLVGLVQEVRAKPVLDRITRLTRPRARAMRDGAERDIDPAAAGKRSAQLIGGRLV